MLDEEPHRATYLVLATRSLERIQEIVFSSVMIPATHQEAPAPMTSQAPHADSHFGGFTYQHVPILSFAFSPRYQPRASAAATYSGHLPTFASITHIAVSSPFPVIILTSRCSSHGVPTKFGQADYERRKPKCNVAYKHAAFTVRHACTVVHIIACRMHETTQE